MQDQVERKSIEFEVEDRYLSFIASSGNER